MRYMGFWGTIRDYGEKGTTWGYVVQGVLGYNNILRGTGGSEGNTGLCGTWSPRGQ